MALEQVPFGGLAALQADELVPLQAAIDCTNCQVDDGTIFGRNGYRCATSGGGVLANGHGTATSGSSTTLVDSGKSWTSNQWATYYSVSITAGTGANQVKPIVSNTATTLTVSGWTTAPDSTSVYQIQANNPQGLWRYRPGPSYAWSLAALNGKIIAVTDPSSETASDGTPTTLTNGSGSAQIFGQNDNISGAQLGTYFYLASDNLSYYYNRIRNSSGTLVVETQSPVPKGSLPTYSAGNLSFVPFGTHSSFSYSGGLSGSNSSYGDGAGDYWVDISGTIGGTATYDLGSAQNWEGCKWLFVACSPETQSGGGGQFSISIAAETTPGSGMAGAYYTLATISDPPGGNGSPYCVYLSLASVGTSTLSGIRYIQFKQIYNADAFSVYGYMIVPTAPAGTTQYFVTFADVANVGTATGTQSSTTLQDTGQSWTTNQWANYTVSVIGGTGLNESATIISNTSNTLTVAGWQTTPVNGSTVYQIGNNTIQESVPTDTLTIYTTSAPTPPTFHAAKWQYNTLNDFGTVSSDPALQTLSTCFNIGGGLAMPQTSDLGVVYTISGTAPASGTFNIVRLWRLCTDGYRLAKSTSISAGGTYALRDDGGDTVLASQNYLPGGLPPPATALAARGGRLICGGDPSHPNRLTISSYVPINTSTEGNGLGGVNPDPFPQFPSIPQEDSDGWAFDISPTASEQILWIGNGDALYIATNEALYAMNDLTPNSPPFRIFERGVVGRRAAIWAEGSLHRVWGIEEKLETGAIFWASTDGIYTSYNRVSAHEMTKSIRRIYRNWLQPDSTTVLAYQDRKLYCICGTRMLRFDFVTETWSRHTPTHTMLQAATWKDPAVNLQRLFFLGSDCNVYRWQPGIDYTDTNRATSDAGKSIPAWTYSTGYAAEGVKTRLTHLYADVTGGTVTISPYKDSGTTNGPPTKSFATSGEHEYSVAAYMSGTAPQLTAAVGYKWRLALGGGNTAQVRRVMWDRETTTGHGG